jgi:hypothetical protein
MLAAGAAPDINDVESDRAAGGLSPEGLPTSKAAPAVGTFSQ